MIKNQHQADQLIYRLNAKTKFITLIKFFKKSGRLITEAISGIFQILRSLVAPKYMST